MKIEFHDYTQENIVKHYVKVIKGVFKHVENSKNMHVIFVTNEQIHELNKNYRNVDRPTDVLSFPNDEDEETLGDIFISIEKVVEQANEYGHSIDREVGFLAVHGYLHLMGYDHHTKEEEKEMMELTEIILEKSNLKRGV
ncbi:rRNA maturation RNase YbeY [Acholeplasma equifetale]|uniref:rRNA maturation RNase YbeY n=1 Tax=Acholeplasma equifetale TaxID=264634 RepID=UPI00047BD79B|nr:rRNA maturation RNase YbeY [Acholeplasma equifetale]